MVPELRTLIAVARHGTFAAAGDRIGLTQAAVSGHVRRLENALGFALFERTGRSAVLNAAGLRTLARAEEIVARVDALGEAFRDDDWNGSLKVGAIASVQATVVARALVPFRTRFPRCRVHVSPGVSLHLLDRIDAGDLDLAVLIRPSFDPPKDVIWQPLLTEEYVLLTSMDINGDDWLHILSHAPFIRYDRSSFGGRQVDRLLKEAALQPQEWLEMDDVQAMVSCVQKGLGVAIVPLTEAMSPLPEGIRSVTLGAAAARREIGIMSRRTTASEPCVAFAKFLLEAVS
jgi:DNA-binding transcriptional LysR family regulator